MIFYANQMNNYIFNRNLTQSTSAALVLQGLQMLQYYHCPVLTGLRPAFFAQPAWPEQIFMNNWGQSKL